MTEKLQQEEQGRGIGEEWRPQTEPDGVERHSAGLGT